MRFASLSLARVGLLAVLPAASPPAAWAVPIPQPGVHAEAVLEDQNGVAVAGPISFSAGQPGVADVNAFTGAVNEARGRARLPGSVGSQTRLDSPGTSGVVQGRAEARQITNWQAIYRGSGPAPAMVEIDVLAVYRGFLTMGIGASPVFPNPGDLFASIHAELNIHNPIGATVTHVFSGDAKIELFEFIEIGVFAPSGAWSGDWIDTRGTSGSGGRAEVDTFQLCHAGNSACGTTLVPVGQVFGFEVLVQTEAKALGVGWGAESDFLATLGGTPMISDPDFVLAQVPEPGTAALLAFGLLIVLLARAWLGAPRTPCDTRPRSL